MKTITLLDGTTLDVSDDIIQKVAVARAAVKQSNEQFTLFRAALEAMDKYTKAVEMDFPENIIDELNAKCDLYLMCIVVRGWQHEFEEFVFGSIAE